MGDLGGMSGGCSLARTLSRLPEVKEKMSPSLPESSLSWETFRRLADHFPGFLCIWPLKEDSPRLLYANPAFWALLKEGPVDVREAENHLLKIIPPEDHPAFLEVMSRLRQGEVVELRLPLLGPGGKTRILTGQAFPLEGDRPGARLAAGLFREGPKELGTASEPSGDQQLVWEAQVNSALAELSQAVISSMPPKDFSRLLLAKAKALTQSSWGSVAYLNPDTRELVFPEPEGEEAEEEAAAWDRERWRWSARWARCLAERRPLLANPSPRSRNRRGSCSFLCVPAIFGERLLGQIALATRHRNYQPRDLEAVARLASLLAIALERQHQEEARRQSEERFRALVEAMHDLVWEMDAQGHYTYVSPKVYDLLGYRPEEVLGRTFLEFLAPGEGERLQELLGPVMAAGKPFVFVGKTSFHKCGRPVVLESSGMPIWDARGRLVGYRGIDRDITERHRAAEALLREKEKYRTLAEEAPLGVAIIGEDGTYRYINPKFVELFGYTLADVPNGRAWFARAFPDPEYRRQVKDTWIEDLKKSQVGEIRLRTFMVTCKDGSQKIINFRSVTQETGDQLVMYEDITERFRAEAALKESESKYRLLVSNIPAVVFRGYADWSVEFFDDKVEELTGYPRELFNQRHLRWKDLIVPEDLPESERVFRQALKTSGHYLRQYRIRHKEGHLLWLESRGQIVKDEQGRIDYVYGVFFDITKQKEIERALRESEVHLKTVMDSLQAGVVLIDAETRRIEDVNRYATQLIGLGKDQLLGRLCHESICPRPVADCPASLADATWVRNDCLLLTARGEAVPILKSFATIKKGGRTYFLESFFDLTEQKRVEQDLAREKERLQVTLRSIGDGVIATDTQGRVVLMNQVAESLTGWSQEEARQRPVSEIFTLVHQSQKLPCDIRVDWVLRTGKTASLPANTLLLARNGVERLVGASVAPIVDHEDQVIGVVLVFRDVTHKRQMEAELLKMEKLSSLGILAGGIAHDFNNILTGIMGNLSLAMVSLPSRGELYQRLAEAEQATLRARDLVQQLLTFAKGGAPVKELASLEEIIRESATFAGRGSQVRCVVQCPKDLWPAEVDPGQISQVIQNLVINAIQAMPTGGTVTITAENTHLGNNHGLPLSPGRYVKITVQDQGLGIPPDYLPKIFDPYFSTKQKGSGLGLATAYSIIKNHQGYITVESTLGVGTQFFIYLPASSRRLKRTAADRPTLLRTGQGRILVMDDDPDVRQVAGKILEHLGYEAGFATDGAEAIKIYQEARQMGSPYDAVIMDLTIPGGMGGQEALRVLKEIDPGLKAIVSSGYADDPVMTRFKEYGFSGVIKKPYRVDTFSQVLYEVLQARSS